MVPLVITRYSCTKEVNGSLLLLILVVVDDVDDVDVVDVVDVAVGG